MGESSKLVKHTFDYAEYRSPHATLDTSDKNEGNLDLLKTHLLIYQYNENSILLIQEPSKEEIAGNEPIDPPIENSPNRNLASGGEADMSVVSSIFENFSFEEHDNKENEQMTSTRQKKWYEGVVIRPVAFRSTKKRSNQHLERT